MAWLIVVAVLLLAYSNGANDNFKGVATLYGSGAASYRRALAWATVTTFAGSMLALWLAHGLIEAFRGKGLVPDTVIQRPDFALSVVLGAALTVLAATFLGLPVSTTHALTGGLVGAGLVAANGDVEFGKLGGAFLLPLLAGPLAGMFLALLVYPCFRWARRLCGVVSESCLCIGSRFEAVRVANDGALVLVRTGVVVETGRLEDCVPRYAGTAFGLDAGRALDALHFLTAGAVGYARGLNDTPKNVALLLVAATFSPNAGLALVAVAMAVGGVLNAKRVAITMSRKITAMNPGQGFSANLVTAALVLLATRFSLPVSTTHVSVGALFGIGLANGTARYDVILKILLAWVTTLPLGALLAAAVCAAVRGF